MSELRQDVTTREWVILAPERARRPRQRPEIPPMITESLPERDAACPFCPGNEADTSDEVVRYPSNGASPWSVRVIKNRYPALAEEYDASRTREDPFSLKMGGYGFHEVIVDTPVHNLPPALTPYEHIETILTAYQERYNVLKQNPELRHIIIFKNNGWAAGTSLVHPHSQLVATPVMAPYFHHKFDVAHDYHADMGRCLYCDIIKSEQENDSPRLVAVTDDFVVYHPYAPHVAYETWIVPRTHISSFGLAPRAQLSELAKVLKDILYCLYVGLDNPDYNMVIDSTTTNDETDPYYHWHIRIIPRLSTIAGFEMGSGIYISSALPEETAAHIRSIARGCPDDTCIAFQG